MAVFAHIVGNRLLPWRLRSRFERWVETGCRDRLPAVYRWLHTGRPGDALNAVTRGPMHHFFGYYEKTPWNRSGRLLLAHEVDFNDRPPGTDDGVTIGLVRLDEGRRFVPLARAWAWNWQQGAMLQWHPADAEHLLIHNDRREGRHVGVVRGTDGREVRLYDRPIYAVAPDGRRAFSLNFARLQTHRPGYGYAGLGDPWASEPTPEQDGIHAIDLETGDSRLIVSTGKLARIAPKDNMQGGFHYINHIQVSPAGSRIAFFHVWRTGDSTWDVRLYTVDPDGGDLRCVLGTGMVSHYDWLDGHRILVWAHHPGHGDRFLLCDERRDGVEIFGEGHVDRRRALLVLAGSKLGAERHLSGSLRHADPDAGALPRPDAHRSRPAALAKGAVVGRDPLRLAPAVEPGRTMGLHRLRARRHSPDVRHRRQAVAGMSRALILMYHLVGTPRSAKEHRFCTPPEEFTRQMDHLVASYSPIALDALVAGVRGDLPLPDRAVHVTFDDGFAGVFEHAAPVLAARSIPATLFAVSDRLGQTNDWMTERGFPERPLMTAAQLRQLEGAGFVIGSHTKTHARLTELDSRRAADEVVASKRTLEDALGKAVAYFAYPYGLQNDAVRGAVVDAGYGAACATISGFNRSGQDPYLLRRIDVFGTDRLWQFKQKLRFGRNESSRLYELTYYVSRFKARFQSH